MMLLLSKKVSNNEMSIELMDNMINDARNRFNSVNLRDYNQGATYVNFQDMVRIHSFESSVKQNISTIDDLPRNTRIS